MKPSVLVGPPGAKAGGSIEPRAVEDNRHSLADAAYEAAADETGSVSEPGRFVALSSVPVEIYAFKFKAWKKHVTVVRAVLGENLVALTGSGSNLAGLNEHRDGWLPSDPLGAKRLFDAWSKEERPTDLDAAASIGLFEEQDPLSDAAYLIYSITEQPLLKVTADVLLRVDHVLDDHEIVAPPRGHKRHFERIILGAPLIVREPPARPWHP